MYKSPIEVCVTEMQHKFEEHIEGDIMKIIQNYGISIDKDELIKALDYDRQQYEAGYRDGMSELADKLLIKLEECRNEYKYVENMDGACAMVIAQKVVRDLLNEKVS